VRVRSFGASLLLLSLALPARSETARRVALRLAEGVSAGASVERIQNWARREGVALDVASDATPVPEGAEVVRVSLLPVSETNRRRLERFPVKIEARAFVFDGRTYREPSDAIALADPRRPGETLVLGIGEHTAVRLAVESIFPDEEPAPGYRVVSAEVSKTGRWNESNGALAIDRAADRDEIAEREELLRSLRPETRDGVRWLFREAERPVAARWQRVLAPYPPVRRQAPLTVRILPDSVAKARETGSSRPADLVLEGEGMRLDLDASAPTQPDLTTPVLAAAAIATGDPKLAERETLLLAAGARAAGRWWGRDVATFAAFLDRAGVEPEVSEIVTENDTVSPVLAVGAAASWLEAGRRKEGESAVRQALRGPESALSAALARWREIARRAPVAPPPRRPIPAGFLRGISYAMSNSIEGGYASPRSRGTIASLARISVDSISVMPMAFAAGLDRPEIAFVHRNPRGETDEGTVRAVTDARALGMSAMVKPQLWLPGGAFVGDITMKDESRWKSWFGAYRKFLIHHAIVAEASGAAIFCVGAELTKTEGRERDWREAIAAARWATGAPLTYAANWASSAERVPFWDALDLVGVDFYDPLSKNPQATDADLEAGARAAAEPLRKLARRLGKPIVFAEVGYPPVRAAWLAPHDESSGRPRAPLDAARSVAALFRALGSEPWWKGAYWWKVFSDGRAARSGETGFNLLGTPAEAAIAAGFQQAAARAAKAP